MGSFLFSSYSAIGSGVEAGCSLVKVHSLLLHFMIPFGAKTSGWLQVGQSSPVGFSHIAKSHSG